MSMKPYRGRVIISCGKESCVKDKAVIDAACAECEYAETQIVDLAEKPIQKMKRRGDDKREKRGPAHLR